MGEKPIIFSGPMVKAILDGRKSQTRRVLKPQPYQLAGRPGYWNASGAIAGRIAVSDEHLAAMHHYAVGDVLWVRETWAPINDDGERWVDYRATPRFPGESDKRAAAWDNDADNPDAIRWRSPTHLARKDSRISLTVTAVKVERLNDISEDDAAAEGLQYLDDGPGAGFWIVDGTPVYGEGSVDAYEQLWEHIHGAGSWEQNPWVVAISFERLPRMEGGDHG